MGQFSQFLLATRSRRYGENREEEILVRRNTVGVISSSSAARSPGESEVISRGPRSDMQDPLLVRLLPRAGCHANGDVLADMLEQRFSKCGPRDSSVCRVIRGPGVNCA